MIRTRDIALFLLIVISRISFVASFARQATLNFRQKVLCVARDDETPIVVVREERASSDGTVKLLVRLQDGLEVETVVIPPASKSIASNARACSTVCVSSQVRLPLFTIK